jgi:mono/diheme cytochrome c family protein
MKRMLILGTAALALFFAAYTGLTLYDTWFGPGRMWETPALRPHEEPLLVMDSGVVPFMGGESEFRMADAAALRSPFAPDDPDVPRQGAILYGRYCQQCHGVDHDGQGTVGQSFAPLPGDLRTARVQAQAAGQVFQEISYGRSQPGSRQPALATTIFPDDRWRIVHYVKSLGPRP